MGSFDAAKDAALTAQSDTPATDTPAEVAENTGEVAEQQDTENTGSSLVTEDGLLNVEAFENDQLREAAGAVNSLLAERLAEVNTQLAELGATQGKAKNWDDLVNNPETIKQLYTKHFGGTVAAPPVADGDESDTDLDVSAEAVSDPDKLAQVLQQINKRARKAGSAELRQLQKELLAAVDARLAPLTEAMGNQQAQSRWSQLCAANPEANTPEYRKEIAKVLGSGRIGRTDYEMAFHVADAMIRRRNETRKRADTAVRASKKAGETRAATPSAKTKVNAENLEPPRRPGSFSALFGRAREVAGKKLGTPKA